MAHILVYHNPHFLDYRGAHSQIVPPVRPVATVQVPAGLPVEAQLQVGYARTQHGYAYPSWFHDLAALPHLRSTAVGDLLALPDGTLYVVESVGFRPYQPKAIRPIHRLAAAYRQLDEAAAGGAPALWQQAARESLAAMEAVLDAEGHPASETPVLWEKAQVGDVIEGAQGARYLVVARRLRPKWRAKRLLARVAGAEIWIDGARTPQHARDRLWAVLAAVEADARVPE